MLEGLVANIPSARMRKRYRRLFPVILQTLIEEVEIGGDVFVEGIAAGEGFAGGGVEGDVEGLGVGTELVTL